MYPAWAQFLLPENLLTNPDILEFILWERVWFSSVELLSLVWLFATHGPQHSKPPWPSPTHGVYSNPLSRWCHPTISSSVVPFCSRLQFFPASGSFEIIQLFAWACQTIGISFSGFPCGSAGKESASNAGDLGLMPGLGRSPGKGKATHSSILAWRIPWTV